MSHTKLLLKLVDACRHIAASLSSDDVVRATVHAVEHLFGTERSTLFLMREGEEARPFPLHGDTGGATPVPLRSLPPDEEAEALLASAARARRQTLMDAEVARLLWRAPSAAPVVCHPVWSHETPLGVLAIQKDVDQPWDERQLHAVGLLAEQIAVSLQNARAFARVYHDSITDPLTGLYNRRYFLNTFERELARAQRQPTHFSIALADIDDFKLINDEYGHIQGDIVLQSLGSALRHGARKGDVIARYGGEEFILLLQEATHTQAKRIIERLRHATQPIVQARGVPTFTFSVGIASYPRDGRSLSALLLAADRALYVAKNHKGRTMTAQETS